MIKKTIAVVSFFIVVTAIYFPTIRALITLSYGNDVHEYLLLIPFISGYFFYRKWQFISRNQTFSIPAGSIFILAGSIVWIFQMTVLGPEGAFCLSLKIFSMVLVLIGGAVCFFGTQLFKNALFPVLFLFLLVPIPDALVHGIVSFYQSGTAEVADCIFKLSGAAYFRDGLSFYLPTLSITIAPECSGIHSSTALIITGMVAGQLFLRTIPGKAVLVLLTIPLMLIKNGIRVATLSLLGTYVNRSFINGPLHHKGGIVFFLIAIALLFGGMFLIKGMENRWKGVTRHQDTGSSTSLKNKF